MKIQIVARNCKEASEYLRSQKSAVGCLTYGLLGKVRVWHGDVMDISEDLGYPRNLYSVTMRDQPAVQENAQYVV